MPFFFFFKTKKVASEAVGVSVKASLGKGVSWPSPARFPPLMAPSRAAPKPAPVPPGGGWTHGTLRLDQVLTRLLSKFCAALELLPAPSSAGFGPSFLFGAA